MEIERKFRVASPAWRDGVDKTRHFAQGYFNDSGNASVRVRIEDETANLNIKAAVIGSARAEYEYSIPWADAREMLDTLCLGAPVEKTRHWVRHGEHVWEIDVFEGANAPLIIAEIELDDTAEAFSRPGWLGAEITDDGRFYSHALAFSPYRDWQAEDRTGETEA